MNYCPDCGTKLQLKYHPRERKELPFCEGCERYKYPQYNTAVSMIVTDESGEQILLIRQYGGTECILTAGYVNLGESAENAAAREIKEELDLEVVSLCFNRSSYFARSNTLMLNFTAVVKDLAARPNEEIDSWVICSRKEAKQLIRHGSLAEQFLLGWLKDTEPAETTQ